MALWNRVITIPILHQQMKAYYDQYGLYGVRSACADWIESRLSQEKATCLDTAAALFKDDLLKYFTAFVSQMAEFNQFSQSWTTLTKEEIYSTFQIGVKRELQFIQAQNDMKKPAQNDPIFLMNLQVHEIVQCITTFEQSVLTARQDSEQLQMYCNQMERFGDFYNRLYASYASLLNDLRTIVSQFKTIQLELNNELKEWQRKQAFAGNGAPYNDNLDAIQSVTETIVGVSNKLLPLMVQFHTLVSGIPAHREIEEIGEMVSTIRTAQEQIILSSFIVEKQPPQVMKTNTRFASTVRWLIGPQLFPANTPMPTVDCVILSELQAQRFCAQMATTDSTPNASGEILNHTSTMEFQSTNRHFSASFRNMQLKKIKRTEKKGTESVMDEKFALLFITTAVVGDYRVKAWTLSLPVVVIVHGNQEPQSWATITWDNAFADIGREPFQVPERVCWTHLSNALNTKFLSATGRGLGADQLQFLCEKLFRGDISMMGDQKTYITWSQFCKEPLPDRAFTFWEWFFAIMKLTKDHLLGPWKAGTIVGFIDKLKTTDEVLSQCAPGTFLLRFSDSELGGITAAFVTQDRKVLFLQPWTSKDLNILGLADRIKDLKVLQCLYPNTPKLDAFSSFCTPVNNGEPKKLINDGYVRSTIKATCAIDSTVSTRSTPSPSSHAMPSATSPGMPQSNTNENMYCDIDFDDMMWQKYGDN